VDVGLAGVVRQGEAPGMATVLGKLVQAAINLLAGLVSVLAAAVTDGGKLTKRSPDWRGLLA